MPIYNHAHYLIEAVESVLNQTELPQRVLLIDDCSSDDSAAIAASYAKHYDFIEFHQNTSQMGLNRILNEQVASVTTEYVFFMASDDSIHPELCEVATGLLSKHPEAGVFSALSNIIDEKGCFVRRYYAPIVSLKPIYLSSAKCKKLFHSDGNWIVGCTRFFRTKTIKEIGGFPEEMHSFSDTYVSTAVLAKHGACFCPRYLSKFRISGENYSLRVMRNSVLLKQIMQQVHKSFIQGGYLTEQEANLWKKRFTLSAILALFCGNKYFNLVMLKDFFPNKFPLAKKMVFFCYPVLSIRNHFINGMLLYILMRPRDLLQRVYRYLFFTLPCRLRSLNDDYIRGADE